MLSWNQIDTVLLDMDGTLLDLHYDNTLWNQLLPSRYGEAHDLSLEAARSHLFSHMHETRGQLMFYCLDHWAEFTSIDIVALHEDAQLVPLIRYRPNAERFLDWLRANRKRALLVTNAHRDSLRVKDAHSGVTTRLDADVSCHDYGTPKETLAFWQRLMQDHPYDPERTLLIDDNDSVLAAAAEYGIRHLMTVSQPDSGRAPRGGLNYPAFNDFAEIAPLEAC
ncbi:MAG: GMP/IMP nucleotidase [Pseudomonadales bacterium]